MLRVEIFLEGNNKNSIILPINYNSILQGFIYDNLPDQIAEFIHNNGFKIGKRTFKLFTFSRIIGKFKIENRNILFRNPIKIVVASAYDEMIRGLASELTKRDTILLGGNELRLSSINVEMPPLIYNQVLIKMLSPITVYSTLLSPDGKKKTYYYSPFEEEFSKLIKENLIRKYTALYGTELTQERFFKVEPKKVTKKDEKIVKYKGTVIRGWMGQYILKGNIELIKLAYYTGLGSKNSQGFGCFEIVQHIDENQIENKND